MNPQVYESVYLCAALLIERLSLSASATQIIGKHFHCVGQTQEKDTKKEELCGERSRELQYLSCEKKSHKLKLIFMAKR